MPDVEISWRDVSCSRCSAKSGDRCSSGSTPHAERRLRAVLAALPTPLLGYPPDRDTPHIVSAVDRGRCLCGCAIELIPILQPAVEQAHPVCKNLLGKVPAAPAMAPTGVCPVCVSEEDLDEDGHIRPHKQLFGLARTDVDCDGAGQKPEDGQ